MLEKYIDMRNNEYNIYRDTKNEYKTELETEYNAIENTISIQIIKDAVKSLKVLLDVKDVKIFVCGHIGNHRRLDDIEVKKINNTTIEIMDYNKKDEIVNTKIKVNFIENIRGLKYDSNTCEYVKDDNGHYMMEDNIYYTDFIDQLIIKW